MKDKIIEYFVNKGIHITIDKSEKYGIYYNLNTGMKSHAHMVFHDKFIKIYMRYGEHDGCSTEAPYDVDEVIDEICHIIKGCLQGRDYLSSAWESILVDGGYLKKQVETTTKVSYS